MAGKLQDFGELGLEAPAEITRVIERCVAKDPDKRYQSAQLLLHDLKDPAEAARRRHRTLRIAAWGLAALLAVAAGVAATRWLR